MSLSPRLLALVFAPFAAGFFFSYLFRNVNAIIAKDLAAEFSLSPADVGLLTSLYLLSFAAMQAPVGVLLDRYGPRRVVASLLCIAGLGALEFALAAGFGELALGRALIGFGVSACLMGSFKAFTLWFPLARLATLNGWMIAFGGLGGLAATSPLEALLGPLGWRAVFVGLAAGCALAAAAIFFVVPEKPLPGAGEGWGAAFARMGRVFATLSFWRIGLP
ncbi:MAG: MFS transporter, partial [Acidobacteriota bacterium]